MKNIASLLLIFVLFNSTALAQTQTSISDLKDVKKINSKALIGAWTTSFLNEENQEVTLTTIITEKHFVQTAYNLKEKRFDQTFGGTWSTDVNYFIFQYEFSSSDNSKVGKKERLKVEINENNLKFGNKNIIWTKIDNGNSNELTGAWLFATNDLSSDTRRGEQESRKTMKILSDTRFQWIAYDTTNGQFIATGGGKFETKNGKYIEHIEFFSRNKDRVGATLSFDYKVKGNDWHHSGMNSSGEPLYEIWTLRK